MVVRAATGGPASRDDVQLFGDDAVASQKSSRRIISTLGEYGAFFSRVRNSTVNIEMGLIRLFSQ
jgi:hypothetical protein